MIALFSTLMFSSLAADVVVAQSVKPLGFYSNERSSDGEHSTGFSMHVWTSPKGPYILLSVHEGEIGDGRPYKAIDIEHNLVTGQLAFKAEYTPGKFLQFLGVIERGNVKGTFKFPSGAVSKKQILKRCCEDAPRYRAYPSFEALEKEWRS
jgi:hypothetical protein